MSVGKRKPSPSTLPQSPGRTTVRVVESPCPIAPSAQISGAGQCLFLLFRDELQAFRQRQIAAVTTPARELSPCVASTTN